MKIYLVSCAAKKLDGAHPAEDLYISPLFKLSKEYVKKHIQPQNGDKWFILSAKHHLLAPETEIENYNQTLNDAPKAEKMDWARKVMDNLRPLLAKTDHVVFLAGKNYTQYLIPDIGKLKIETTDILKGKRVGERLKFLREENAA